MSERHSIFPLLYTFILMIGFQSVHAQTDTMAVDKLYLKDGMVIEGKVDTVRADAVVFIGKVNGSKFEYPKSKIKRVELSDGNQLSFYDSSPLPRNYFKLYGGANAPLGAFGSTTGSEAGYAKTGFAVAAEFDAEIGRPVEIGVSVGYHQNSIDAATYQDQLQASTGAVVSVSSSSWTFFSILGNAGFNGPISDFTEIYGKGRFGIIYCSYPEVDVRSGTARITQSSGSAAAIAYGVSVGILLQRRLDLGVQLLFSDPEADVTLVASDGSSRAVKVKQPVSVVGITFGVIL